MRVGWGRVIGMRFKKISNHSTSKQLVEPLTEMDVGTFTELMHLN